MDIKPDEVNLHPTRSDQIINSKSEEVDMEKKPEWVKKWIKNVK